MRFTNKLERHQSDQRHKMLWVGLITQPAAKPMKPIDRKPKQPSVRDEQRLMKEEWK